jgi:hypothetical protein
MQPAFFDVRCKRGGTPLQKLASLHFMSIDTLSTRVPLIYLFPLAPYIPGKLLTGSHQGDAGMRGVRWPAATRDARGDRQAKQAENLRPLTS